MDIRQLENFIEVCRQASLTKAANNMYITQQGMSKSIRNLETELGVPLFSRRGMSLTPTEYGRLLLKYAENINEQYLCALGEIEKLKSREVDYIKIGIPHGLTNTLPENVFSSFRALRPDVNVLLEEFDDYALDLAVESGEVNIGFCVEPVSKEHLVIHSTHVSKTYYLLPESHPLANSKSIDLRDLKNENFIGFGDHHKGHQQLVERCLRAGFSPRMSIQSHDADFNRKMCSLGLGIGFHVGNPDVVLPGVKIIPDKVPNWNYSISLCTASGKTLSAAEETFINAFKKW